MKVCCKAIVACLFFSSFSLGYTSKISFEQLTVKLNFSEEVYAAPNLGQGARSVFKFLSVKIAEGALAVGVANVLVPKDQAPPPTKRWTNPFSQLNYVGSYFQCSRGCKYYWSKNTGWKISDSDGREWDDIEHPPRTVVLTHDIYLNKQGDYVSKERKQNYGFEPQRGWVYF